MEQSEDMPPKLDKRTVRPRLEGHSQGAPGNERTDEAMSIINPRDSSLGGQHYEGSSSGSLPVALPPHLPRSAGPNVDSLDIPHQAIVPPRADDGPTPTLIDVNPESGSITGGARIWLKGKDFPALIPLFARFGTAVVPTVSTMETPFKPYLIRFLRLSPIRRQVRPIYRAVVQPLLILYIGQTLAKLAPVGKTVSSSHDRQYSSILPSVPLSYHPSASCHAPVVSSVRRCCHVSSAAIAVAVPTRRLPPGIVPAPPGNM